MESKIKVCHVTSVHSRYDTRVFYKECTSLAKAGFDVTLLVADGQPEEALNGVHILSTATRPHSRLKRILKSSSAIFSKALEINAVIYHLHDPELLPLGVKLKRIGKKVIFDSHENYPAQIKCKYYLPALVRNLAAMAFRCYETFSVRNYDAVITPCTFYGGVDIFAGRCQRTQIISNTPLLSEFYNKYRDKMRFPIQPLRICHVGGLTYARGITYLIKAAHMVGVKLMLAGEFSPPGYHEELMMMPEYECVDYRGFLSREALVDFYHEVNIGIATILNVGQYNTGDNFATKVYEYMSMSLPVIVSKYSYSLKVLEKYKFGISVDPENVDEIADAIKYLINNPQIAKQMGENGRRAVKDKFNWDVEEKKLCSLYQSVLGMSA